MTRMSRSYPPKIPTMNSTIARLKSFFSDDWPEIKWGLLGLVLWAVLGMILEPFSATYGLSFLHKAVITFARVCIAIALTELAVKIAFPTIRNWAMSGSYKQSFESSSMSPETKTRLILCTAIYGTIFAATMVSLSL